VVGEDVERIKRRMPLLDYLRQHNWKGRLTGRSEYVGICPLHQESQPSFYVNTRKNVFYCHGCGQGGDLIRFVQLSLGLSFRQSLASLDPGLVPEADSSAVLEQAAAFYRRQLNRYPEALDYLYRRGLHDPALIEELGIGYASGGSMRRYLIAQGHSLAELRGLGLINAQGSDALYQRIVFHCISMDASSTCTAAASAPPSPIASCPAERVACMPGSRFPTAPKSSWSKGCSTMPLCGRRDSTT